MLRKQSNDAGKTEPSGALGEDAFRSLYDQSTEAIFIVETATGSYLDANAAAETLTGYPRAVLRTLPPADVVRMDENRWLEHLRSPASRTELGEVVYLRSDGTERVSRLSMVPIDDASVFVIARDITEQKHTEKGLIESERKIRSIFRAAPTGIGVVQHRILREVNARFCEMSGYSREELIGCSSRRLYPSDEEFDYVGREKYRQIAKRGIGSVETRLRRKDGSIIHILMRSSPLDPHDLSAGVSFTALDITDWKQTEKKLRQSEEKYRIIANFTYDWEFWLRPDGSLEFISPACERITGYPPDAFYSDPSLLWSILYAEDRAIVNAHLESSNHQDTGTCSLDFRIVTANGRIRWVNHYCLPVFADDGTFLGRRASNRDISERKRDEEKLKASEQRFRELYDNMRSGVAICDTPDGGRSFVLKDVNQSCLDYCRNSKDAVIGRNIEDVFPGVESMGLVDLFRRVWTTGIPEHHPASYYKDDRIEAWVENYVCKLPSGELVAICEDITAKRQSQEAQERMERQIQQAQKLESIGVLAGGIAHDFNNILFPITGMSELLMEDLPQGSPEHENATEIYNAARRAGDLVRQILSFSRRAEPKKLPTRIQQLLAEIVKLVRSTIPSNIEIAYDIQNDCGQVMADSTQLHQIAMNLITNAYHAVESTGGRITISLKEVSMGEDRGDKEFELDIPAGRYARFSVADTGCGIDSTAMEKIFKPYFTTKAQDKGTGLGLSVVYGIVKEHHGDIRVISHPGMGTTMDLYFPVLDTVTDDETREDQPLEEKGVERIMVIDDEVQVALLEKQVLERLGYRVAAFTSSIESLDAFSRSPESFDLVITDITMPHLTGDQLAKKLIAIRPSIRIIACSGFSERVDHDQIKAAGIRGFLMKPIARSDLIRMVRQVLDEVVVDA